jgi:hypothetical protein
MSKPITRFDHEFVAYNNVVIAVPYRGEGSRFVSLDGRQVSEMSKIDKLKEGSPVYWSDLGNIHSLAYRTKHRQPNKTDDKQELIAGIGSKDKGILLELEFPRYWDLIDHKRPNGNALIPIDIFPEDILPVYLKGGYVDQDRGNPAGLLVAGLGECRLVVSGSGESRIILPDKGRFPRYYHANGIEVIPRSERIYATAECRVKKQNITDSLHKAGVDIPRTLERFEDFGRWKVSEGIF